MKFLFGFGCPNLNSKKNKWGQNKERYSVAINKSLATK
jgi:hypothetical protein